MKKTVLVILTLILLSTNELSACVCVVSSESLSLKKKIEKAFSESDLIFVGKVIDEQFKETEIYVPEIKSTQKYSRAIYTFELMNLFTGKSDKKEIEIVTTNDSCGLEFQVREVYLVYSNQYDRRIAFSPYLNQEKVNPFYATDRCTRTKKIGKATEREIKKLERLAKRKT